MSHCQYRRAPIAATVHRSPGWRSRLTYLVGDWRRYTMGERQHTTEAVPSFDPDALRRLRRARGLSHDALGAQVGVSRPSLIAYEKGIRGIGVHTLHLLSRALGVDPLELTTATRATATVADLRARVGLSKSDLAELLGIHRTMWARIEQGSRRLRPELMPKVAGALEVSENEVRRALERGRQR